MNLLTDVLILSSEKHAPPAKAIRNEGQRMIPAKFEGEPTYRSKYMYLQHGR